MPSSVSVVIPTYNGAEHVAAALESVHAQSLPPEEIVVVDDCSTDDTVGVVERHSGPVPLRLVRRERNSGGPATPMAVGFEACRTRFVATLDQDDRMAPDRLRVQVEALRGHPEATAAIGLLAKLDRYGRPLPCDFIEESRRRIDAIPHRDGATCRLLDPAAVYAHVLSRGTLTIASSTTFRKSAWQAAGGFDSSFRVAWDFDISLNLTRFGPLAYIPEVIGEYRIHPANTSAQGTTTNREVLLIKRRHLDRPLHPIDRELLRRELRDGYRGLVYTESDRGHTVAAWRALLAARRSGLGVSSTLAEAIKAVLRAARAGVRG
jgi:glycosyltransferase involved in cell wall biosynthesis